MTPLRAPRGAGRSLETVLAGQAGVPRARPTAAEPARVREPTVPVPGYRKRGWGWSPAPLPLPRYELTSDQAGVLWPLINPSPMRPHGAFVGTTDGGSAFWADMLGWVSDPDMPVTNPNVQIFGAPGQGKSALVKTLIYRLVPLGYQALVLGDVKDEYEQLCQVLGVEPIRLGPGLPTRVNPLDLGPDGRAPGPDEPPGRHPHRRKSSSGGGSA